MGAGAPASRSASRAEIVEERLRQTSLYRPDLDLAVFDDVAAYGLFWHDPTTAIGLVEPMRTEDAHQRRGLARHILATGIARLAAAGATRIKICFEPDNEASKTLYLGTGLRPIDTPSFCALPLSATRSGALPRSETAGRAILTRGRGDDARPGRDSCG